MSKKRITAVTASVLAGVMVISLLASLLTGFVNAASSSEIQNQIDILEQEQEALKEQMAQLESDLEANKKDIKSMIARKNGIDQQIALLHAQITVVKQTITAYNLMIADKQDELDMAEKRLGTLYAAYKDRIRAMEEQGEISYWSVIFEANSFFEMLDHINMVAEIARADRQRLDEIRKVAQQVDQARVELQEHKKSLEQQRQELEATEQSLAVKRGEADGLLLELLVKGDEYAFEMDESEKLQHDLMNQIAGLENDKELAEYLEWLATSVPPTTTTTVPPTTKPKPTVRPTTRPTDPTNQAGSGNVADGYVWYVPTKDYKVTSEFGPRTHPVTGKPNTYHYGIDLAAAEGTPIFATRDGVVRVAAYQEGGAGYYVSLGHEGGYISVYMHMTHYIVKKGEYVKAGQIIGYVGSTGGSTGNHLHFGIVKDGTYMNPRLFLDL